MPGSTASALTPMCRLHCRACLFRAKCRLRVPLYSKQASEQSIVSFVSRTHDMMSHGLQPRLCRVCITIGGVRSYTPTYLVPDIAVHVMLTPAGHIGHGGRVELHAVLLACTMPCTVRCMISASVYEPIRAAFPAVQLSNFAHAHRAKLGPARQKAGANTYKRVLVSWSLRLRMAYECVLQPDPSD